MGGKKDISVKYSCDPDALADLQDMVNSLNSRLAEKRGKRDAGVLIGNEVREIDDFCLLGRILGKVVQWILKHEWELRHEEGSRMTDRDIMRCMLRQSLSKCVSCKSTNVAIDHEGQKKAAEVFGTLYWVCNDCGSTGVVRTK